MLFLKKSLLPALILLGGTHLLAQEKCGTVEYEKRRRQLNPRLETIDQFENWMSGKLAQLKAKGQQGGRIESTTYTIPVVVHVIHNGEPIGTGTNVSDAQVISQIQALNRDFPRLNPDTTKTPVNFKPVAGSININFVLAQQDPEGLATTGITRTKGTKTGWTLDDNVAIKALSYWPAENYLNIWVVNFVDPSGIIGYSQLPLSTLGGLQGFTQDRLTDGVVIHYLTFGSNDFGGNYNLIGAFNKGRTGTHELGHIFGERHVWGDVESCSGTDYVADTPTQLGATYGAPATTTDSMSCGHYKMFENYMDYSNDSCYNLFTQDQIARMIVVLGNSPRRASLLVSPGANPPVVAANDLGTRKIISPTPNACPAAMTPSVQVRNYGTNLISSTQIQLSINGTPTETKDFSLNLNLLDTTVVSFSPVTLTSGNTYTYQFKILFTNGGTDGNPANDSLAQAVVVPQQISAPFLQTFNSLPASWTVVNPDALTTWQLVTAPDSDPTNTAMYMDFYDYENVGESDQLISPVFDLSGDSAAILRFDYAYTTSSSSDADQLRVLVSTSCDFSNAVEVFNESGTTLATVSNDVNSYIPTGASDWKTVSISLNQFAGQSNVQIAFVATDDYGNNLYLDNISVVIGSFTDLSLVALKSPSPVTCLNNVTPAITLKNNGNTTVTGLTVSTSLNGGTTTTQSFSGLSFTAGEETDFTLNGWTLNNGTNTVTINVQNSQGLLDVSPSDNTLNLNEVVNTYQSVIPLRQNFDGNYPDWTTVSPTQQVNWLSVATNYDLSLEYAAFGNSAIGSQAWLVSPVLDFSKAPKSSIFFDLSYAESTTGNERLQILSSTDCGQTFPTVEFDQTGDQLETTVSNSSWAPQLTPDWKQQYVNLDDIAGNAQVRLAFVITNDDGNNLFLDNVEIYADDNQNPVTINSLYSVYDNYNPNFKITFNLPELESVRMQIFSTMGKPVIDTVLSDVLNQTYDVDLSGQSSGVYIVRLQIGNQLSTAKVVVP